MKRGTITFLKLAIFIIGIVVITLCVFWLPSLANKTAGMYPEYAHLKIPTLIGMYLTLIPFSFALYQALRLLRLIENKHAFSNLAISLLRHIKNSAVAITILYIIGAFFLIIENAMHPGIAIIGLAIVFASLAISFFAAMLQELLRNALEIKTENDLTI